MFNKKIGMIFGLSLCCLVGCTSTKPAEVASVADRVEIESTTEKPTEIQTEISTEVEAKVDDTIEAAVIEDIVQEKGSLEVYLGDENVSVEIDKEDLDTTETLEYLNEENTIEENVANSDAELVEDADNVVISSIGTITSIEDNMILVAVDNASETYAQISDMTVCDAELAVGDRVEVKHSMVEMRSLPGIWPQVYEITIMNE